jgi:hypothetical protein
MQSETLRITEKMQHRRDHSMPFERTMASLRKNISNRNNTSQQVRLAYGTETGQSNRTMTTLNPVTKPNKRTLSTL